MDEEGWTSVNGLLRQHGLPAVDVFCVANGSIPTVVLTAESAKTLRKTLMTLMKDGDTRRQILLEMITVNNHLREELNTQRSVASKFEEEVKELQTDLNESHTRLKDIEAHSTSRSSSDERPKELIIHTRLLHLQLKCDTYEQELNRLTAKLQRLNSERSKSFAHIRNSLEKQSSISCQDGRGDSVFRPALYRCKQGSSHDDGSDILNCSTSTESENYSTLKSDIKSCESSLLETKQRLNTLEEENEKLKLELSSRPQMKDLREAHFKIKQLQSFVEDREKDKSKSSEKQSDLKNISLLVEDLSVLPADVCRKYLKKISEETGASDLNLILSRIEEIKKANEAFPQLQQLAREVLGIVERSDVPCPPGLPHKSTMTGSHQVWCERTWYHVLPTLEFWVTQLKQLKELQLSIKNLAERLFPWKPVKLEGNLTMVQLIELVDSFIWEDDENEIARRIGCCRIRDEPVDKATLKAMVQHFQLLFDVPHLCGIYPKMSDVYRRLKETGSIMQNLKEILGLDESSTSGTVVDAVTSLCETHNEDIKNHLANLFQTDDIHSILLKIEGQDKLLCALEAVVNNLMCLLRVNSLDDIVPTVSHLVDCCQS